MSLECALLFLHQARSDEAIGAALDALSGEATWDSLVAIGAQAGLAFSAQELERAHALDWTMRWTRYRAASEPADENGPPP